MGNLLGSIAPSEIFPVEHYLTGFRGLSYHASLGSTRFLKVARAKVDDVNEVWITVKVFVIHDPSLPLKPHILRLKEVSQTLKSIPRCLPYQVLGVSDKAAVIHRPYMKYSLYDRINTRPFLLSVEKAWFAYQLLLILKEMHSLQIFHGDIKSENVMTSSWQALFLTDFASFKPVDLPADNPADFAYFFDTSGKRKCYIAPERFTDTASAEDELSKESGIRASSPGSPGNQAAMDIFSAGCVLAELFTEGECLFDLSQLLAYKYGKYHPEQILSVIDDPLKKKLVCDMIHVNGSQRLSAEECLKEYEGTIFPPYFEYWFDFVQKTFDNPSLILDDKISRVKHDLPEILRQMGEDEEVFTDQESLDDMKSRSSPGGDDHFVDHSLNFRLNPSLSDTSGLVLIAAVVTSSIRGLHFSGSKITVLEILEEIARRMPDELVLDRIIPFVVELVKDDSARVRAEALHCLTRCLARIPVTDLTGKDANVFPEFIFPEISATATDRFTLVRCSLAANIAVLAETALRFVESIELNSETSEKKWAASSGDLTSSNANMSLSVIESARWKMLTGIGGSESLQAEKLWIQDWVRGKVSTLLADSDNSVKITLMRKNLTRLCLFFGRSGANDVIFSHMITFLNDKDDTKLRLAFYETVVGVVTYIGHQCSGLLKPLLLQGLSDTEEFVTVKALNAMMSLVEIGLLDKYLIFDLVDESVPFVCHPNPWVRHAAVGFLAVVMQNLSAVDVRAKVHPHLASYLTTNATFLKDPVVLWDSLREPIPRIIYYGLLRFPNLRKVLDIFKAQEEMQFNDYYTLSDGEADPTIKNFVKRLYSDGLTPFGRSVLLRMKDNLLKLHVHYLNQRGSAGPGSGMSSYQGMFASQNNIDLDAIPKRKMDLCVGPIQKRGISPAWEHRLDDVFVDEKKSGSAGAIGEGGLTPAGGAAIPNASMNREWMHMFGGSERFEKKSIDGVSDSSASGGKDTSLSGKLHDSSSSADALLAAAEAASVKLEARLDSNSIGPPIVWNPASSTTSEGETSLRISQDKSLDNNFVEYRCKPCRSELKELVEKRMHDYSRDSALGFPYARGGGPELFPSFSATSLSHGSQSDFSGATWVPSGKLVNHLHEHRAGVTRLIGLSGMGEGNFFASSSSDGSIRLWDASRDNLRSRIVYNVPGNPVHSAAWCSKEFAIASMTASGSVDIISLEGSSAKPVIVASRTLNVEEDGMGMELMYLSNMSMLVYVSSFGIINGWDLRTKHDGFRITQDLKNGVCTCACVEPSQQWLAVGTTGGVMTCYDLRFRLPAGSISHPGRVRVRKMLAHPLDGLSSYPSGSVVASFKGNNEVAVWNFETQSRQMTLWASPTPPLSTTQATHHSICAICLSPSRDGLSWFLGGTDMRVRLWNTSSATKSAMVCTAGNDTVTPSGFHYSSRLMEGCEVVVEGVEKNGNSSEDLSVPVPGGPGSASPNVGRRSGGTHSSSSSSSSSSIYGHIHVHGPGPGLGPGHTHTHGHLHSPSPSSSNQRLDADLLGTGHSSLNPPPKLYSYAPPPSGHHDGISDIIVVSVTQSPPVLVTSSRDGVIKIWK